MVKTVEKPKKLTEKEKTAKALKLEKEKASKQKALEKERAAKKAEKEKVAKQKALEKEKAAKQKALEKEKAAKQKALEKEKAAKEKARLAKTKTPKKEKVVKPKKEPVVKPKKEKSDKSKLLHLIAHPGNVTYNHRLKEGTPVIDIHDLSRTTSKKKKTTFVTGLAATTLGLSGTSSTGLLEKAKDNFAGLLSKPDEDVEMMDVESDQSQLE
jgi:hypothetical protein